MIRYFLFVIGFLLWQGNPGHGQDLVSLVIEVKDAPAMRGWSVSIEFDSDQINYFPGSFEPSMLIPNFQPLVQETEEGIAVGGAVLGSGEASGNGILGNLQFSITRSVDRSQIMVTQYALSLVEQGNQWRSVQHDVVFMVEPPIGDFTGDGTVDFSDFFRFGDNFGGTDPLYDLVPDGVVDFGDFFLFADSFGKKSGVLGARYVIPARDLITLGQVVIVGTTDTTGIGIVDITGTIAPKDTVNVEVVGTISE